MTQETQSKLLGEFYAEKKNILKLKGEDYANEDVLSNFKTAGANIGISAEQQCLSLIATKVARLGNLLSGKTPNNESVSDSILDLSNYTDLLYCLVNKEKSNQKSAIIEIMKHDEKDGLYNEQKTKRWENIKPKAIINQINWTDINEPIKEVNEPITELYEPKVGDRFEDVFKGIWEVTGVKKLYYSLMNNINGDFSITNLLHSDFYRAIGSGTIKKIN